MRAHSCRFPRASPAAPAGKRIPKGGPVVPTAATTRCAPGSRPPRASSCRGRCRSSSRSRRATANRRSRSVRNSDPAVDRRRLLRMRTPPALKAHHAGGVGAAAEDAEGQRPVLRSSRLSSSKQGRNSRSNSSPGNNSRRSSDQRSLLKREAVGVVAVASGGSAGAVVAARVVVAAGTLRRLSGGRFSFRCRAVHSANPSQRMQ